MNEILSYSVPPKVYVQWPEYSNPNRFDYPKICLTREIDLEILGNIFKYINCAIILSQTLNDIKSFSN